MTSKEISNPYSTGNGGGHFENQIQSAFTLLMLAGGVAPCLPAWPITQIKLQGKYLDFETDDLIVSCNEPNSLRSAKLLAQIKHTIKFTKGDSTLSEVLSAAWSDFNNTKIFSERNKDVIALVCGPLSGTDTNNVRALLEQARYSPDGNDFFNRIERGKFTSDEQREKLEAFKTHLRCANQNIDLTKDQLWRFLKAFHLLLYDLDIKGVVHSLLYTLIEIYSKHNSKAIWAQICEYVQEVNERAGIITLNTIPDEIKDAFKKIQIEAIPEQFVKDTSKVLISNWNNHELATELAIACLVGSWNENIINDKLILSRFAHIEYERWIIKLREILQLSESPIELKDGIWRVKDRVKLLNMISPRLFDEHLDILRECAKRVLTEKDPKFELQKQDRFAAKLYNKVLKYSSQIRKGLAESLALLGNYPETLKNTSIGKSDSTIVLTIREIFEESDWMLWASLNDLLPTLAEANPDEFLRIVEHKLKTDQNLFTNLFAQEGNAVTDWNYMTGLLWALEALAWEDKYLVSATVLLGELATKDPGGTWANRPANSLTTIFLPWKPQTNASFERRKIAILTLDKELPEVSWKLLLSLLPHNHQVSTGTYKPKFRRASYE